MHDRSKPMPHGAARMISGAVLAAVAGLSLASSEAGAQSRVDTAVGGPPIRVVEPQRVLRPTQATATDDQDLTSAPPEPVTTVEDDLNNEPGIEPRRVQGRRVAPDGEPALATQPGDEPDGIIPTGEPLTPTDGDDPTRIDTRLKADRDAFDTPPAGFDSLIFQIEGVTDPILDRRPARLARFEPYDPIGIKRGSWVIFPEIETGLTATSNTFRNPAKQSDLFFDVRPTLRAVTDWRRHAVEVRATGLGSWYNRFSTENDRQYALEVRARYDLSRRTSIEVLAGHDRTQDSRSNPDAADGARTRAAIDTDRVAFAVNHRFNRVRIQLRGSLANSDYDSTESNLGVPISNVARDVLQREIAFRASYEFKPALSLFSEVALNDRTYKVSQRDSAGERVRMGLSFGNAGKTWRGEVAAGWGRQRPEDGALRAVEGLILDANLGWRISALTSLLMTARTDFNDTTIVGANGVVARQAGVELRHAFRRHLIGTAGVRHTLSDYRGTDLEERETVGELGLEYFVNRNVVLSGRYTHLWFNSTQPAADYTVDTVRIGMKIRQ